jgi:pimeloyl-ACP methyl ester carboxylesterase
MTDHTHQTAPTQHIEANGIRFAYRRFGKPNGAPLVFNQHFTGTMDHWDPAVTDGFARNREVVLFNNAGVSSSSGEVPTNGLAADSGPVRYLSKLIGIDQDTATRWFVLFVALLLDPLALVLLLAATGACAKAYRWAPKKA